MNVEPSSAVTIFYSYAQRDEQLRIALETHLSTLQREGLISNWYDRKIGAGQEWAGQIDAQLNAAQIILLLISADFIASDYCYDVEMKRALERHEAGEAHVIPIILRPVDWRSTAFGKLQALPANGRPVTAWRDRDQAFLNIAQGIRNIVEGLAKERASDASVGTSELQQVQKQVNEEPVKTLQPPRVPPTRSIPPPRSHRSFLFVGLTLVLLISLITFFSISLWGQRQSSSKGQKSGTPSVSSAATVSPCPPAGTAVPFRASSFSDNNIPTIVYVDIGHTGTSIKSYNVKTGVTNTIVRIPEGMDPMEISAQVSRDGRWLLVILPQNGEYKLQMIQVDGKAVQTLYCVSASQGFIKDAKLSFDGKWIVFYQSINNHPNVIYLMNVLTGTLQPLLLEDNDYSYWPYAWINETSIYVGAFSGMGSGGMSTTGFYILNIANGTNQQGGNLLRMEGNTGCEDSSIDKNLLFISYCTMTENGVLGGPSRITVQQVGSKQVNFTYNIPNLAVRQIVAISSTTLLLLIKNGDNTSNNGLWKMVRNNSQISLTRLVPENVNDGQQLNMFTVSPWSNVSLDGSMYAIETRNADNSSSLLFGSMSGGSSEPFVTIPPEEEVAIVGWAIV